MASTLFWPQGFPDGQALPLPRRDDYSYQARSPVLNTDFGLLQRATVIYSDAPSDISLGWSFSAEEWALFHAFYEQTLAWGTRWFWMPIKSAGVLEWREVNFHGRIPNYGLRGVTGATATGALTTRVGISQSQMGSGLLNPNPTLIG